MEARLFEAGPLVLVGLSLTVEMRRLTRVSSDGDVEEAELASPVLPLPVVEACAEPAEFPRVSATMPHGI